MTDQVEAIEDAAELAQVRRQARGVNLKSAITALVLMLLALLVPSLA